MKTKKKPEYVEGRQALENFENAMTALMKVSHSEIKAKLDVEKKDKAAKKSFSRASQNSSSDIDSDKEGK